MKASYYWTADSFGAEIPDDWAEIAAEANDKIDNYKLTTSNNEEDIQKYSEVLWDRYCHTYICDNKNATDVVIPDGTKVIGGGAFYCCQNLQTVTIPDSVDEIQFEAFSGCKKLKSIYLPGSIQTFGADIFSYCTSLESVEYGEGCTHTGYGVFDGCTALKSVKFPSTMKKIDDATFTHCTALESITLPDGLRAIGRLSFQICENLTEVIIPDSVKIIAPHAFYLCNKLNPLPTEKFARLFTAYHVLPDNDDDIQMDDDEDNLLLVGRYDTYDDALSSIEKDKIKLLAKDWAINYYIIQEEDVDYHNSVQNIVNTTVFDK